MAQLVDVAIVAAGLVTLAVLALLGAFVAYFVRGMVRSYRRGEWRFLPAKHHRGRHRLS